MALDASSGSEDGEYVAQHKRNIAKAYNQSIYLMLSVPYVLVGVFGFMIYRGVKKNEEFRRAQKQPSDNTGA